MIAYRLCVNLIDFVVRLMVSVGALYVVFVVGVAV